MIHMRLLPKRTLNPTPTELIAFQNIGAIGTIELRNWLSELYPEFKKSRRSDVDSAIEQMGDKMAREAEILAQFENLHPDED